MIRWLRRLFRPPIPAFPTDRAGLVAAFLEAGRASGMPRGLRWVSAEATGEPVVGRDRSGAVLALLPVTVRFDPEPGSDLEDVPQARESRPVAAVFAVDGRAWKPTGKAVFNLSAADAAGRLGLR